jgi:hypothetical protein
LVFLLKLQTPPQHTFDLGGNMKRETFGDRLAPVRIDLDTRGQVNAASPSWHSDIELGATRLAELRGCVSSQYDLLVFG